MTFGRQFCACQWCAWHDLLNSHNVFLYIFMINNPDINFKSASWCRLRIHISSSLFMHLIVSLCLEPCTLLKNSMEEHSLSYNDIWWAHTCHYCNFCISRSISVWPHKEHLALAMLCNFCQLIEELKKKAKKFIDF